LNICAQPGRRTAARDCEDCTDCRDPRDGTASGWGNNLLQGRQVQARLQSCPGSPLSSKRHPKIRNCRHVCGVIVIHSLDIVYKMPGDDGQYDSARTDPQKPYLCDGSPDERKSALQKQFNDGPIVWLISTGVDLDAV
jgi:hypothetical protein